MSVKCITGYSPKGFQTVVQTQCCGKQEKGVLGQRAESRLNCRIKLILDFLVSGKISIPSCSGRLKNCV